MNINQLSYKIIQAAITVHRELGPGLLESVYQTCMNIELNNMDMASVSEKSVPVKYKGEEIHKEGFRMDLLIENTIIVELKSVEKVKNLHKKQLLTYLRLTDKKLGLLINFNEEVLKNGITRIIN